MIFMRASAGWRGRKAAVMALVVLGCGALTWVGACGIEANADPMKLLITGLNHQPRRWKCASAWRSRKSLCPERLDRLSHRPGLIEGMILSTCNRVEVAVTADEQATPRIRWTNFWRNRAASSRAWVTPYLYHYDGPDAIRHLFRVASSLDSMVVGEPQILGQLKTAYALAKEHGAVSGFLDLVMTRASMSPSACAPKPKSARARYR